MHTIKISSLIQKRVLTARTSVDAIAPHFADAVAKGLDTITLDFSGIRIVSPSAVDQLLTRIEGQDTHGDIQFVNMPLPSSQVHRAIARAHGRKLVDNGPHSWVLKAPVESHA